MTEAIIAKGSGPTDTRLGHGLGGDAKAWSRTVEITAAAASGSTYDFGYVPSNAKILGLSKASWDDCASTGAPTFDLGLYPVDSNFATGQADALNDGLDITAAGTASAVKDIANYGKKAWQYVSALTSDPKGSMLVRGTLQDAAANTGGTVTLELLFLVP